MYPIIDSSSSLGMIDLQLQNLKFPQKHGHSKSYASIKKRKLQNNRNLSVAQSKERKARLLDKYMNNKSNLNFYNQVSFKFIIEYLIV